MGRFALGFALAGLLAVQAGGQTRFVRTDLVTSNAAAHPAPLVDPSLVNAWGISMSTGSPFWVGDNGAGVSTLYVVNPTTNVPTKNALTVTIPGAGNVTGTVFAGVPAAFNGDNFLFVSEDGLISGWRAALGTTAEILQTGSTSNVYKGMALVSTGGNTYALAANFRTGLIDILKGSAGAPNLTGNFTDPSLPVGFAPFNVQTLGGKVYVAYAQQDAAKQDEVLGAGKGFVTAFDANGNFLARVGTAGALNAPWGLAIAPSTFGEFAGDLLVGNFGSGRINAYDLTDNSFDGPLTGADGNPLVTDGLWALTTGNGGNGGSPNSVYFSAGPDGETNGLLGVIAPVPEPGMVGVIAMVVLGGLGRRGRRA